MRWMVLIVSAGLLVVAGPEARAGDEEKRIMGGVLSGLLGQPPEATYTEQERDRLVSLLQSGEYVTSRQGEPVDLMVYGVPLTHRDHVYSARPIPPSQTAPRRSP